MNIPPIYLPVVVNILTLLLNFVLLAANTLIKSSIESRLKQGIEKYKDNLRKQRVSGEKLEIVWEKYRDYYATLVEDRLSKDGNGGFRIEEKERELVHLLEREAPFIPENIFNALQSILDSVDDAEFSGKKVVSREEHQKIISLFREFLT